MLLQQLQMNLKTPWGASKVKRKRLRYRLYKGRLAISCWSSVADKNEFSDVCFISLQEAEAFALYHKALDLQKHNKLEESADAYHELLKTPLLKEVKYHTAYYIVLSKLSESLVSWLQRMLKILCMWDVTSTGLIFLHKSAVCLTWSDRLIRCFGTDLILISRDVWG